MKKYFYGKCVDCGKQLIAKSSAHCRKHFAKYRSITLRERFFASFKKTKGCWIWKRAKSLNYGIIHKGGRNSIILKAHRVSYEIHKGLIPKGLYVCHKCDNPPCVRPSHLWLGTAKSNIQDCSKKGRLRNQYSFPRKSH